MVSHPLTAIHPSPAATKAAPDATPLPVVYMIVASEKLPTFDPTISIKHLFMSDANARWLAYVTLQLKPLLVPLYFVGLAFRLADVFVSSLRVAEWLAVLSVVFQIPTIFLVLMAFRLEYVKLLMRTFEFCFLVLVATIWVVSASVYQPDWRAVLLPIVWIDFIDLTLIETLFGLSRFMAVIAVVSGVFITSLTFKITLTASSLSKATAAGSAASVVVHQDPTVSSLDALANAMGTMVMLLLRLAYRKHAIAKRERRGVSWAQSIGYRCRVALRVAPPQSQRQLLRLATPCSLRSLAFTSATSLVPRASATASETVQTIGAIPTRAVAPATSKTTATAAALAPLAITPRTFRRAQTARKQSMRFIAIPMLIRADATVSRSVGDCSKSSNRYNPLSRSQLVGIYSCGVVGYALSTITVTLTLSSSVDSSNVYVRVAAVTGLSATTAFCVYVTSCCQRQLLQQLVASFDVAFLSLQLFASHLCLCELYAYDAVVCCGTAAELLWMHFVLLLDALTPAMKTRLRLRTWCSAPPIVLLYILKHAAFLVDVLVVRKQQRLQNRLLMDVTVASGVAVQFRVFPFFFSRLVTVLIWCIRILHRIYTRKSESDLVMLLGNVEFDCRQAMMKNIRPTAARRAAVSAPVGTSK